MEGERGCVPECRKRIKRKIKQKALTKRSRKIRKCNVKINLPEAQNVLPVSAALLALLSAFSLSASERKVQLCTKSVADLLYVQAMKRDRGGGGGRESGFPYIVFAFGASQQYIRIFN